MYNCSLEPVISEEDAQFECEIPAIEIIEFDRKDLKKNINQPIKRPNQQKHHDKFVQRLQSNYSKLDDPTLLCDLELHETQSSKVLQADLFSDTDSASNPNRYSTSTGVSIENENYMLAIQ